MALGGERVETEPSSFEEAVQQPVWIDAMVEKYDSIVWNNVLDAVPRPEDKSVMSSRWLYKLSQAMVHPTKLFWKAMKHVLRYLRGTSQYGIWFRQTKAAKLQGFIDADSTGSPSNRKSTSGEILNLCSVAVSWYNKTHRLVALSSTEAEYMSSSQATCEAIWMWKMLVGLFD
eukprot:PITA_09997